MILLWKFVLTQSQSIQAKLSYLSYICGVWSWDTEDPEDLSNEGKFMANFENDGDDLRVLIEDILIQDVNVKGERKTYSQRKQTKGLLQTEENA